MTETPLIPSGIQKMPSTQGENKSNNKSLFVVAGIAITAIVIVVAIVGALLIINLTRVDTPEEVVEKYIEATYGTCDVEAIEDLLKPGELRDLKQAYGASYEEEVVSIYCQRIPDFEIDYELDYDHFSYTTSYKEEMARVAVVMQGTISMAKDGWKTTKSLNDAGMSYDRIYMLVKQDGNWYLNPKYRYVIYLNDLISQTDAQALMSEIEGIENTSGVEIKYVSKADALEEMKGLQPENPRWEESLEDFEENPFPASVSIVSPSAIDLVHIEQSLLEDPRFKGYISEDSTIRALYVW